MTDVWMTWSQERGSPVALLFIKGSTFIRLQPTTWFLHPLLNTLQTARNSPLHQPDIYSRRRFDSFTLNGTFHSMDDFKTWLSDLSFLMSWGAEEDKEIMESIECEKMEGILKRKWKLHGAEASSISSQTFGLCLSRCCMLGGNRRAWKAANVDIRRSVPIHMPLQPLLLRGLGLQYIDF